MCQTIVDPQKYEVADHRRTRRNLMFLLKEKEAPKITGRWVSKGEYSALVKKCWEILGSTGKGKKVRYLTAD